MKKLILTLVASLGLTSTILNAHEGFYVGGVAGANFCDTAKHLSLDTGFSAGATAGYAWNNGFRTEAEIMYRRNEFDSIKFNGNKHKIKGHVNAWTYGVNGLYDIETNWGFTPYVGVGVVYAENSINLKKIADENGEKHRVKAKGFSNGFIPQFIAGVSVPVNRELDLGLEYRLLRVNSHRNDHSVGIALRKFF